MQELLWSIAQSTTSVLLSFRPLGIVHPFDYFLMVANTEKHLTFTKLTLF